MLGPDNPVQNSIKGLKGFCEHSARDLWRIKPLQSCFYLLPGYIHQLKLPCQMITGRYSKVLNNLTPNPSSFDQVMMPLRLSLLSFENGSATLIIFPTGKRSFIFIKRPSMLKLTSSPVYSLFLVANRMFPDQIRRICCLLSKLF